MLQSFKNTILLIFIVAIIAPTSFAWLSYQYQLKKTKKEVKALLIEESAESDLVKLEFELASADMNSLKWEHGHEFEYQGKMFDIVKADTIGTMVHYLCFPDKQETALNIKFKQLLAKRFSEDEALQRRAHQINVLLTSLFCSQAPNDLMLTRSFEEFSLPTGQFLYTSLSIDLESPPPQS